MPSPLRQWLDDALGALGIPTPPPIGAVLPPGGAAQIDPTPVERLKARILVQAVQDAVLACLRDNSHLFAFDAKTRNQSLADLSWNLWSSAWSPEPLTVEDMDAVGWNVFDQIVWATADGRSLWPLEAKCYERLRDASDADVPPLRGDRDHRPATRWEGRSRRRLR